MSRLLVVVNEEQRQTAPDDEWAKGVCKTGKGAKCCFFLTVGPDGWQCQKARPLGVQLMFRASLGMMTAQSDNCEGRS
jgi:hypothetical protein